ncbi:MAG: alkaline phosphatase family protein [Alphaproteobacteria bacterium]|nr:alkaline phosphatase family protein [Alphaproteobacteria bacterium]
MPRPIILLEFNEIVPQLIERFIADGRLPHFSAFRNGSDVFTSQADEPEAPYLEPWIQWYSVHTGLPFKQHGVFRLTDGLRQDHDDVWRILARHGQRIMNLSSMNARPFGEHDGSVYLPDPWCSAAAPHPAELLDFHKFVARMVQEYTNTSASVHQAALRFIAFMTSHGLSLTTVRALSTQLFGEKLGKSREPWQRASLLDAMLFDVFRHYYKQRLPDFATFFVNSTAHYQHAYWRDMDPALFGDEAIGESPKKNAILFGYQCMDRLLGELMRLAEETGALLILSSALSQQPYLDPNNVKGRAYYRFHEIGEFLRSIGVTWTSIDPVMTNQYRVHFNSDDEAVVAAEKLARLTWEGRQVVQAMHDHQRQLYLGIGIHDAVPDDARLSLPDSNRDRPFYDLLYKIDVSKSGRHHPDGVLWFRTGRFHRHEAKPSILDILPTLLDLRGIDRSASAHLPGKSLAPLLSTPVTEETARKAA